MKKIMVAVIDNGGGSVKASWAICMLEAFKGRDVAYARVSDSHADRHCNKAASLFLESDCTEMLIIDTDIIFRPVDIQRILSHDVALVYGIYPKKNDATEPCLGTLRTIDPTGVDGLVEVRWAGRGFMRVKREVLEAMKEENGGPSLRFHNYGDNYWHFFNSGVVEGDMTFLEPGKREWVSEDIMFCLNARKVGFPTYVDAMIALGHEGSKSYFFATDQVTRTDGWHGIDGWFTDSDAGVYRQIAEAIPADGMVAEVGTWLGRSMGALIEFCKAAGKSPTIHAIDTFKGTLSEGDAHTGIVAAHGGSIRAAFEANMKPYGLNGSLIVHEADSIAASHEIADNSLDAIFIDGDHERNAVLADIEAWYLKVKRGGIMAGHDYDYPGVADAVRTFFGNQPVKAVGRCWCLEV